MAGIALNGARSSSAEAAGPLQAKDQVRIACIVSIRLDLEPINVI
jgi:hypothetical protein